MGIFAKFFGRSAPTSTGQEATPTRVDLLGESTSAVRFAAKASYQESLTLSAVWSAINVITDGVAGLPLHVYHGTTRDTRHPLYALLHDRPNEFMTSVTFRTAMMASVLLWGRAFAYIERDVQGRPVSLLPMPSADTFPVRKDGQLFFVTRLGSRSFTLSQSDVLYVIGLTLDGINGLSPIEYARRTCGISVALETFADRYFSNGCNPGGVIEAPAMERKAREEYAKRWRDTYGGMQNAFKVVMIEPGQKFTPLAVSPESAQAIEQREHQIREIARIFKVPPHKLGDLARATFSNIEHQSIEFMQETIRPWAVRLEQEMDSKLLLESERGEYCIRFNLDALLRADTLTRYRAYQVACGRPFMLVNEVRETEGLPPVDGGEKLFAPLNMQAAAEPGNSPDNQDSQKAQ